MQVVIPTDEVPADWNKRLTAELLDQGASLVRAHVEEADSGFRIVVQYAGEMLSAGAVIELQLCMIGERSSTDTLWPAELEDTQSELEEPKISAFDPFSSLAPA